MKILCVHQGWELYGSDRSFLLNLTLLKELFAESEIKVIIPKEGVLIDELIKMTPLLEVGPMGKVERLEFQKKPIRSILKIFIESITAFNNMRKADLVYINTIAPYAYLLASLFHGKKVIVHVREIPPSFISKFLKWWFILSGVTVIFNSKATAKAFYFEGKKQGIVIPNAVEDIPRLDSSSKSDKINIMLIGRINSWKGHFFFLDTFKKLDISRQNDFRIIFLGDAPEGQRFYRDRLEEEIKEKGLADLIRIESFKDDVSYFYNWADYVIVPSILPEPFGRVAVEAFSVCKPVIAANHGGLNEIVTHKKNGYLFSPNNQADLVSLLLTLPQRETKEYLYLAENAYETYKKQYSIPVYKIQFKEVLDRYK